MSSSKVRYKYKEHDFAYVILEDTCEVIEVEVEHRLKKPFRLSDNFYYCSWFYHGREVRGIRFEKEMIKNEKKLNERLDELERQAALNGKEIHFER